MSTSNLQISFLGIEEGSDRKNLPPGTLLLAENCQMDKSRRLIKRGGTDGLVKTHLDSTIITAGTRLLTTGKDTALTDGTTAHTYSDDLAHWMEIDRPTGWRATRRGLADSTRSIDAIDTAISGNLLIVLYVVATGALYYQVDDLVTGAPVVPATVLSTATCAYPRILVSGGIAYMLISAAGVVHGWSLNLSTMVDTNLGSFISTATTPTPTPFDAVIATPSGGVPTLYVAYEEASGANRTVIASFTLPTLTPVATVAYVGTGLASICLAFGALSQRVLLAFSCTPSGLTKIATTTPLLVTVAGPTTVLLAPAAYTFIDEDSATNAIVGWQWPRANCTEEFATVLYSIAGAVVVSSSVRTTYGLYAPSKPWRSAGRWYCTAVAFPHALPAASDDATPTASSLVVEIETTDSLTSVGGTTHVQVATVENQTGWGPGTTGHMTKASIDADGNVFVVAAQRNREPPHWYMTIPIGWYLYRLSLNEGDTSRSASFGAGALCAAAAPYWFDGASTMPYGFAHPPCILSITDTGVGSMAAGTYSYVATYAWRDANGLLHRSTPSPPKAMSAGANRALTVRVETSSISGKQKTLTLVESPNPVFIELWRTTVGGNGSHYRLSLEPLYQVMTNTPYVFFVDLVDTKADGDIGDGINSTPLDAQAQLYTDLGELANVPPPSFITVTAHKGRFVGIGPDLRTLWFSKDATQDATLAPGFNEALTLAFAQDKTALASLDATLISFGEDDIDAVSGDGPDDAGNNSTWQIQAVHSDVGCINARSVAIFPGGVIFESRVGLSLIDRGLTVSWIGKSIDDTLALYPNITSAVLVAEATEVRWTCNDGETGIVLAYDYLEKIWFVRKYNDAVDTEADSVLFVDASLIDGTYTLLTAGGQVYRETTAHKRDGGTTYVERDIVLAPISAQPGSSGWANANLGWSRVKDLTLMGTSVTDHDLEVSFAQNYSATYGQTRKFTSGSDVTTPGPLELSRVTLVVQKCQAVQIRIRDLEPTAPSGNSTGDGPIFESLMLRVGALDGPAKTSAGQRG